MQPPAIPSCASLCVNHSTIHKSQGGTFRQIVCDYNETHLQQLVYVALTRVTSLDSLILTRAADDHVFHHAQGSKASKIRKVQNEYKRLENHRLPTITTKVREFLRGDRSPNLLIVNLNVQSSAAHAEDIFNDFLLCQADFIVLTETWTRPFCELTSIAGFLPVHHQPCQSRSGGVALYQRDTQNSALPPRVSGATLPGEHLRYESAEHPADIVVTRIYSRNDTDILLVAIHVHQVQRTGGINSEIPSPVQLCLVGCG